MDTDSKPLIVQSDKTLLLEVDNPVFEEARDIISQFAELEKSPEYLHTYRITPLSLWNAAASKISAEKIIDALYKFSKYPVPQNINSEITRQIDQNKIYVNKYKACLDILAGKKEATKEEFMSNFNAMLFTGAFDQNRATFDNLISSGKIEIIQNQSLLDSLVLYYNSSYKSWDTALRDYTRNITAPYLLNFDLILERDTFFPITRIDDSKFDITEKTLSDYKRDVFIINSLRQKLYNTEGQLWLYDVLLNVMHQLVKKIEIELNK